MTVPHCRRIAVNGCDDQGSIGGDFFPEIFRANAALERGRTSFRSSLCPWRLRPRWRAGHIPRTNTTATEGRKPGHRFEAAVKDLVPFERVDHDDGQTDLESS